MSVTSFPLNTEVCVQGPEGDGVTQGGWMLGRCGRHRVAPGRQCPGSQGVGNEGAQKGQRTESSLDTTPCWTLIWGENWDKPGPR